MTTLPFHPVKLIEEVRKHPGLWSTDAPADRERRISLWKEVGRNLYDDWDDKQKAQAYDRVLYLQKRWRCLRDCYRREVNARKTGIRPNRRVYIYYKKMSFLGGCEQEQDEITEEGDEADDVDYFMIPVSTPKEKARKRPKPEPRETEDEVQINPGEFEMSIPSELPSDEGDSDRQFLLSFLPEIKQLPVHLKMWVRAQIANIMQEAVTNYFNNTTPSSSRDSLKRMRKDSSDD